MLQEYINHLTNSIHSAQRMPDIDLYRIAQQRLNVLLDILGDLPLSISEPVYEAIEKQLPSDWALWMDSCRLLQTDCVDVERMAWVRYAHSLH